MGHATGFPRTKSNPIRFTGAFIDGEAASGPVLAPRGSACILDNNLNADQYGQMQSILHRMKNLWIFKGHFPEVVLVQLVLFC
jgi:hypothetical protein